MKAIWVHKDGGWKVIENEDSTRLRLVVECEGRVMSRPLEGPGPWVEDVPSGQANGVRAFMAQTGRMYRIGGVDGLCLVLEENGEVGEIPLISLSPRPVCPSRFDRDDVL